MVFRESFAELLPAFLQKKENDLGHANSFTKAGMICGIIGIILSALMLIYLVVVVMIIGVSTPMMYNYSF